MITGVFYWAIDHGPSMVQQLKKQTDQYSFKYL